MNLINVFILRFLNWQSKHYSHTQLEINFITYFFGLIKKLRANWGVGGIVSHLPVTSFPFSCFWGIIILKEAWESRGVSRLVVHSGALHRGGHWNAGCFLFFRTWEALLLLPILDKEERGSCPLSIVYCRLSAKHPSRGPGLLKSKNGQRYSHKSTLSIIVIINNSFL